MLPPSQRACHSSSPHITSHGGSLWRSVCPEEEVAIRPWHVLGPWIYQLQIAHHCCTMRRSCWLYENKRWSVTCLGTTVPAKSKAVGVGMTQKNALQMWKGLSIHSASLLPFRNAWKETLGHTALGAKVTGENKNAWLSLCLAVNPAADTIAATGC